MLPAERGVRRKDALKAERVGSQACLGFSDYSLGAERIESGEVYTQIQQKIARGFTAKLTKKCQRGGLPEMFKALSLGNLKRNSLFEVGQVGSSLTHFPPPTPRGKV